MPDIVQGNRVQLANTFRNSAAAVTDPTTIVVRVKAPADTSASAFTYGVGADVVKDSIGVYHINVTLGSGGMWLYRWEGTGALIAATQGMFVVIGANPT